MGDLEQQKAAIEAEPAGVTGPMLERATRRFLIDGYLRALDWNSDEPLQIREEARATGKSSSEKFYFDYLGLNESGKPALLVEAKMFDMALPRVPHGSAPGQLVMSDFLAKVINVLKKKGSPRIDSQWKGFLSDLINYVESLTAVGPGLTRAVITAGNWMIVFTDPRATFSNENEALAKDIECFLSFQEILSGAARIFDLLARPRLINTMPTTLTVGEALEFLRHDLIENCQRGVLIGTTEGGAGRFRYPMRSVYPALIVKVFQHHIGIIDDNRVLHEPKDEAEYRNFLEATATYGQELFDRLDQNFDGAFSLKLVQDFDPLGHEGGSAETDLSALEPITGSFADLFGGPRRPLYTTKSALDGRSFLVATGTGWFYKNDGDPGRICDFHSHEQAASKRRAEPEPHSGFSQRSFTASGQGFHCAYHDLLRRRQSRCQIESFDSHLCCVGCAFRKVCWESERPGCPETLVSEW